MIEHVTSDRVTAAMAVLALGLGIVNAVVEWRSKRPRSLAQRRRDRAKLLTDTCAVIRPRYEQSSSGDVTVIADPKDVQQTSVMACRLVPAGSPETPPRRAGMPTVTTIRWQVELPFGAAVEIHDRIEVQGHHLTVTSVIDRHSDEDVVVAYASEVYI